MKKQFISSRTLVITLFMLCVTAMRVLTSTISYTALTNFTPIGAMALFGGVYFTRYKSFVFPLLTLWLSDMVLSIFLYHKRELFYHGFYWTYGAFILMALVGKWIQPNKSIRNFMVAIITILFIHWIVTDFGEWCISNMYPKTINGLWACLIAAIPFEMNFLGGSAMYGAIMFGGFAWLQHRIPSLQLTIR